jgi:hypothetical protein
LIASLATGCVSWHAIPPDQLARMASQPENQRFLVEDGALLPIPPDATLSVRTLQGRTYEGTVSSLSLQLGTQGGKLTLSEPSQPSAPFELTAAEVVLPDARRTVTLAVGLAATLAAVATFAALVVLAPRLQIGCACEGE